MSRDNGSAARYCSNPACIWTTASLHAEATSQAFNALILVYVSKHQVPARTLSA